MSNLVLVELEESRKIEKVPGGYRGTRVFESAEGGLEDPSGDAFDTGDCLGAVSSYGIDIDDSYPGVSSARVAQIRCEPHDGFCRLTVDYESDPLDLTANAHGEVWEWDFSTSQSHITSVRRESDQAHYPAAADVGVAIGVDGDEIEGCDIYTPTMRLRITKTFGSDGDLPGGSPAAFRDQIADLVGKVSDSFFASYQVLLIGGGLKRKADDGHGHGSGAWVGSFEFLVEVDRSSISLDLADGSTATVRKQGFQYMWFRYVGTVDGSAQKNMIESAHVASVYESGSNMKSRLGIEGSN